MCVLLAGWKEFEYGFNNYGSNHHLYIILVFYYITGCTTTIKTSTLYNRKKYPINIVLYNNYHFLTGHVFQIVKFTT